MKKKDKKSLFNQEIDLSNLALTKIPLFLILGIASIVFLATMAGEFLEKGPLLSPEKSFMFSATEYEILIIPFFTFITGLFQFSFLLRPKLVSTIFSQPVKRSKLFNEKILLPLVWFALSILLTKLIILKEHISVFGFSPVLLSNFAENVLGNLLLALAGFTASVAASVLTNRFIEALLGGVSLLFLPRAILAVIDIACTAFLHGYSSFYDTNDRTVTLIDPVRKLLLVKTSVYVPSDTASHPLTGIAHAIIWLAILTIALLLTKKHFEKRFKYENIGKPSANQLFTIISCFSLSVMLSYILTTNLLSLIKSFAFAYNFSYDGFSSSEIFSVNTTKINAAIFICTAIILAFILNLILTLKIKNIKEKLICVASILLAFSVTSLIASSGCFGYEKRTPATDDILKVSVNLPFEILENATNTNSFYIDEASEVYKDYTFTTKADFELIKDIHSSAINNKEKDTSNILRLTYTLKNGSTFSREYTFLSKETDEKILELWKSDAVKMHYRICLLENMTDRNEKDFFTKQYDTQFLLNNQVSIYSKDGLKTSVSDELSPEEFLQLKKAIYSDIENLTPTQWFKPKKSYGIISFHNNLKDVKQEYSGIYLHKEIAFHVTNEMSNTITFLKNHNLLRYF
ncbi:MAG: hypothetical protein IKC01_09465, partial [Clostridia bacterium]|nr:hypothetical protein [Clostridia bacterium]